MRPSQILMDLRQSMIRDHWLPIIDHPTMVMAGPVLSCTLCPVHGVKKAREAQLNPEIYAERHHEHGNGLFVD